MENKKNHIHNKKLLNKFISDAIKSENINENELSELITYFQTLELKQFWYEFSSDLAYRNMNRYIPEWQTKNQLNELNYLTLKYSYSSNENANSEMFRVGLINHIKVHLLEHIKEEIAIENDYKNQTFWERVPYYYFLTNLSLIPFGIIYGIFNAVVGKNQIVQIGVFVYFTFFCLVWILFFLSSFFEKSQPESNKTESELIK